MDYLRRFFSRLSTMVVGCPNLSKKFVLSPLHGGNSCPPTKGTLSPQQSHHPLFLKPLRQREKGETKESGGALAFAPLAMGCKSECNDNQSFPGQYLSWGPLLLPISCWSLKIWVASHRHQPS